MIVVGAILELLLWVFFMLLIGRLVVEWVQMFARSWSPSGPILVVCESIYTVTDPPVKLFRRFVPPLRLGAVALDVSLILLFVIVVVLRVVNQSIFL